VKGSTTVIATTVETVRDLGVPTIVGAIAGALIAHFTAKARGREEHERTLELLVTQDERRAAQAALDAVREIGKRLQVTDAISYGDLHNEWSDRVLGPARLIRSDALDERARAAAYVIFLATLTGEDASYAVLRGALDVEEWAESWLRRESPPPAHLPPMEEIRALVRDRQRGRVSLDSLNELLAKRA
jgi:hypothetical protein